jgi:hypothetical protein
MTHLFSSPLALPLAFALALTTAGGIATFTHEAAAATAPETSVRCFMGANADAKHGSSANGGWACVTEHRDASH